MEFKKIVGHEDIIKFFRGSIEQGKVSHAYLINGEVDSGKKMLAKAFAATLQCEDGREEACGHCKSCLQMQSGSQPDVIMVTHEKEGLISVAEIRDQVVDSMGIKPYSSRYKVYVIPDAHLMNSEAQNALLKTLEEPPEYGVVILLTCNIDKLLETVRSRCVVLNTKPIRERDMLSYLKNKMGLTEEKAYFCLDFARGNLGKAIKLADNSEYAQIVDSVVETMKNIQDMDVEDLAQAISNINKFKMSMNDYMDLMIMWYRDILMLKVTGIDDKVLFKNEYASLKKQASELSYKGIEEKIDAITKAKKRLEANAGFDVTMELLLTRLKEN